MMETVGQLPCVVISQQTALVVVSPELQDALRQKQPVDRRELMQQSLRVAVGHLSKLDAFPLTEEDTGVFGLIPEYYDAEYGWWRGILDPPL